MNLWNSPWSGKTGRILLLILLLFASFPVILIADLYLTPWRIPSTIIYALPVMVTFRLLGKGAGAAVLGVGLAFEGLDAWLERADIETTLLSLLGLALIGWLSFVWAEAERRQQLRTEELEESRRRLLDFFSMVAHDLRSPLTTIMGSGSMLSRWDRLGTDQRERVMAAINSASKRIARLADDLLDASRIGTGRFEVTKTRSDLVALVKNIVEQQQAAAPKYRLVFEARPDQIHGLWDEQRIAQAVSNLLDNAIKYSPEGGEVRVMVGRTDNRIRVLVSDQGVGIAPEDIPLLFQPYSRLHRTAAIKGTGLGLYITEGIVEAHHGSIEVLSELGKGSTFTISLPLGDPPTAPT